MDPQGGWWLEVGVELKEREERDFHLVTGPDFLHFHICPGARHSEPCSMAGSSTWAADGEKK